MHLILKYLSQIVPAWRRGDSGNHPCQTCRRWCSCRPGWGKNTSRRSSARTSGAGPRWGRPASRRTRGSCAPRGRESRSCSSPADTPWCSPRRLFLPGNMRWCYTTNDWFQNENVKKTCATIKISKWKKIYKILYSAQKRNYKFKINFVLAS